MCCRRVAAKAESDQLDVINGEYVTSTTRLGLPTETLPETIYARDMVAGGLDTYRFEGWRRGTVDGSMTAIYVLVSCSWSRPSRLCVVCDHGRE